MRQAIICTTLTQAFNAVALKRTVIGDEPTDLAFYTDRPFGETLLKVLMASGDFERVTWIRQPLAVKPLKTKEALKHGVSGLAEYLVRRLNPENFNRISWLTWPWRKYSLVWAGNVDSHVDVFFKYVKSHNPNVKLNLFDEGIGSYQPIPDYMKGLPQAIALMRPALASKEIDIPILPMGSLFSSEMASFWALIEKMAPALTDPMPDVLFVDQWLGMPWLMDKDKPDWQESSFMKAKMNMLHEVNEAVKKKGKTFGISVHPSSLPEVREFYRSQGLMVFQQPEGYPIECALALSKKPSTRFVTLYSTGAVAPLWNSASDKTVMLYRDPIWGKALPTPVDKIDSVMASFEKVLGSQLSSVDSLSALLAWVNKNV